MSDLLDEDAFLYGELDENEDATTKSVADESDTAPLKEQDKDPLLEDEHKTEETLETEVTEDVEKSQTDSSDDLDIDDDDIEVTIGNISASALETGSRFKTPQQSRPQVTVEHQKTKSWQGVQAGQLDLDAPAKIDDKSIYERDVESFEDKPWRQPGADITDYFNYGLNEVTWKLYCERQRRVRSEFSSLSAFSVGGVRTLVGTTNSSYVYPDKLYEVSSLVNSSIPILGGSTSIVPPLPATSVNGDLSTSSVTEITESGNESNQVKLETVVASLSSDVSVPASVTVSTAEPIMPAIVNVVSMPLATPLATPAPTFPAHLPPPSLALPPVAVSSATVPISVVGVNPLSSSVLASVPRADTSMNIGSLTQFNVPPPCAMRGGSGTINFLRPPIGPDGRILGPPPGLIAAGLNPAIPPPGMAGLATMPTPYNSAALTVVPGRLPFVGSGPTPLSNWDPKRRRITLGYDRDMGSRSRSRSPRYGSRSPPYYLPEADGVGRDRDGRDREYREKDYGGRRSRSGSPDYRRTRDWRYQRSSSRERHRERHSRTDRDYGEYADYRSRENRRSRERDRRRDYEREGRVRSEREGRRDDRVRVRDDHREDERKPKKARIKDERSHDSDVEAKKEKKKAKKAARKAEEKQKRRVDGEKNKRRSHSSDLHPTKDEVRDPLEEAKAAALEVAKVVGIAQ